MRYSFSAEFLKITPPETSFGNAWESLCFELLSAEHGIDGLQRLHAPDSGIDILRRPTKTAIQCKSNERGAFASLSATESVDSLKAAVNARPEIAWEDYTFATNANYTGSAVKTIISEGASLEVKSNNINFLGPEYWNNLCEKYFDRVRNLFDYRVTVTEEQVIEAFRKARYFDQFVDQFSGMIKNNAIMLKITNNWTPIELEFPFSSELTVENCVDAVQELLGISLKQTNFVDLGTSAGPSISLSVDQRKQNFKQTIGEVQASNPEKNLVFWITLAWKDETQAVETPDTALFLQQTFVGERMAATESDRRKKTLQRAEAMVQTMMWESVRKFENSDLTT